MADLRFVPDHNISAYLGDPPQKHSEFKSLIDGLILSPVNYAIMEHPTIFSDYIKSFWSTVTEHTDSNGNISIIGKIQGKSITITEQILRECLQFGDKDSDAVELDQDLVMEVDTNSIKEEGIPLSRCNRSTLYNAVATTSIREPEIWRHHAVLPVYHQSTTAIYHRHRDLVYFSITATSRLSVYHHRRMRLADPHCRSRFLVGDSTPHLSVFLTLAADFPFPVEHSVRIFKINQLYFSMGAGKGYNLAVECHLDVVEAISSSLIVPKPNGWLYFLERTPGEYEAHGYKLGLGMKDNSESALSTNKEAISNATMNLMESSILAQDECWRHA
ncbi:hypothetical protein E3N88_07235 [Mikania micrantha]|uniref:Uncharacterized protein n=1 Tax=Mikania micrantha TaxID=192012 RepID=A0A5N6PTU9_9ASTR|nr:hypothetical protein E3N88_07235 [Mikania micrantha]